MKILALRLRNLTTGILHSEIHHVYMDLEEITGTEGIMTHMLPNFVRAVLPWLRENVKDPIFWNGQYDPSQQGEIVIPDPTKEEQKEMLDRYLAFPSPLEGKRVVGVLYERNPEL